MYDTKRTSLVPGDELNENHPSPASRNEHPTRTQEVPGPMQVCARTNSAPYCRRPYAQCYLLVRRNPTCNIRGLGIYVSCTSRCTRCEESKTARAADNRHATPTTNRLATATTLRAGDPACRALRLVIRWVAETMAHPILLQVITRATPGP